MFAPTDAAFLALAEFVGESVDTLLMPENVELLKDILKYHVVSGTVLSTELADGEQVPSLNGETLAIGVDNTGVTVNGVIVSTADIPADNGVIHIIDQVLFPPGFGDPPPASIIDIATSGSYPSLVDALEATGGLAILSGEGPFTIFAPTEEAFDKLPIGSLEFLLRNTGILLNVLMYHVVDGTILSEDLADGQLVATFGGIDLTVTKTGDIITINNANVVSADNVALNGVLHAIDTVLIPPGDTTMIKPSIVDIASAAGFTTLEDLLDFADLTGVLNSPGPFSTCILGVSRDLLCLRLMLTTSLFTINPLKPFLPQPMMPLTKSLTPLNTTLKRRQMWRL